MQPAGQRALASEQRRAGRLGKARPPVGARAETSAPRVVALCTDESPPTGASPSALRHAASSRRSGSHRPTGALALVIVTARYGTASHPSADQQRGLIESVAAAERCQRARQQKIDSRDRPDRRSRLSARRTPLHSGPERAVGRCRVRRAAARGWRPWRCAPRLIVCLIVRRGPLSLARSVVPHAESERHTFARDLEIPLFGPSSWP
jgi:hypothetical protein